MSLDNIYVKIMDSSNNRNMEKSRNKEKEELAFHLIHKLPSGDGPYVGAKHAQLVERNGEKAIVLFWKAINSGDRVDSALKDMAGVMKQLDRSEEAIESIKSFRCLCSKHAQQSLDNLLIDLYKKCGKVEEQIALLKQKLRLIYRGEAFNGKPTKTARSHGKKFQLSITQEISRLLGNLGWAYMQKKNYMAAEVVYKKAQIIYPDANKGFNLALCLNNQTRYSEALSVLQYILQGQVPGVDYVKSKAEQLVAELKGQVPGVDYVKSKAEQFVAELKFRQLPLLTVNVTCLDGEDVDFLDGLEQLISGRTPNRSRRLPIFEEISEFRDQLAC